MKREVIKTPSHFKECHMEVWLQAQGHAHTCMSAQDMRTLTRAHMCTSHTYTYSYNKITFLFTVKLPLPSLTSNYPECYGADMLGLKSCLIHEG